MSAQDLARFRASMTTAERGDETYDVDAFKHLSVDERRTALSEIEANATKGDLRAIWTLGIVGDDSVKPTLKTLASASGREASMARRALAEMGSGDDVLAGLVSDAKSANMGVQLAALQSLAKIDGDTADKAIVGALDAADDTVRSVAYDLLVARAGLTSATQANGDKALSSPLEVAHLQLRSDLDALRAAGAKILRAKFEAALKGKSATALDLIYRGDAAVGKTFGKALRDANASFPLDAVKSAHAHDQQAAETLLVLAVTREDERAPSALVALGANWTIAALKEIVAADELGDDYLAAVKAAISDLS